VAGRKVGGLTGPPAGGQAVEEEQGSEDARKSLSEVEGGRGKGLKPHWICQRDLCGV